MMTKQLKMYRAYARFIKRMLFLGGIWPTAESSFLYQQLPVLTLLTTIVMFLGAVRFCLHNINNLSIFTKGLSLVGSFSLMFIKALMFIIYKKQFRELHSELELMYNEALENSQYRPKVLSMLNLFRLPAYMVFYLIMGTMGLYICTPIIIIIYEDIKNVQVKHYGLPFPASFPWIDGTPGIIYQIQYFFEAQYIWFIIFLTGGIDSSYGLSLFQMAGILRAMSLECKNAIKSSSKLENILRSCIKKQIKLLHCRDIIQNIYGPIILDLILTSAVVLCGLIFQAFQTEMSIGKALMFLAYGLLKTIQAFIYAWYGTIIAAEAEAFQQSVYCSKWYEHSENIKLMKNILVILTQKPIVLMACHFVYISLDIFIKIINTSISYYFLLQAFDETSTQ